MSRIIPSLNLNRTPQSVENGSLVYAKNLRLFSDQTVGPDNSIENTINTDVIEKYLNATPVPDGHSILEENEDTIEDYNVSTDNVENNTYTNTIDYTKTYYSVIGHINGLDNNIYLFVDAISFEEILEENEETIEETIEENEETIEYRTIHNYKILDYSELHNSIKEIKTGWKWSGGIIEGITTVNNTNQPIITIGEYFKDNVDLFVPLKHINIAEARESDNESIYTQAPCVPLTNLSLIGTYTKTIPNGVYQFFVRYKIRDNFYTNWFVCSKECFAGSRIKTHTIFGTLSYINTKKDAGSSFVFNVEHLHPEYFDIYQGYQLGFILTTDEKVICKTWKTFTFNGTTDNGNGKKSSSSIHFDMNEFDCEDFDIDEMLTTTYDIYNVKNVDYFRGKLYISNYKEDNFNPIKLEEYISNINIELKQKVFDITKNRDYFDGKILTPAEGDYTGYTHILGSPINELLNTQNFLITTSTDNKDGNTLNCEYNDSSLFYLRAVWRDDVNPDLIFIEKCKSPIANTLEVPYFDYSGHQANWEWGDFFFQKQGMLNYKEQPISIRERDGHTENIGHALKGNRYFDGIWYLASGYHGAYNKFGDNEASIADKGFTDSEKNTYVTTLRSTMERVVNEHCYSKCIITKISVVGIANPIYDSNADKTDRHDFNGIKLNNVDLNDIKSTAIGYLKPHITSIDSSGTFYIGDITASQINVEYSVINYINVEENVKWENPYSTEGSGLNIEVIIDNSKENRILAIYPSLNSTYFKINTSEIDAYQYNTLMPYTDYDFYIHYINDKGIATNGLYIGSRKFDRLYLNNSTNKGINKSLIYPEITNIVLPPGYTSCFISYYKNNNTVAELFEIESDGDQHIDEHGIISQNIKANSLEFDMLLYPVFNNIQIYDNLSSGELNTGNGKYFPSYSTESDISSITLDEYGNAGIVKALIEGTSIKYEPIDYSSYFMSFATNWLWADSSSSIPTTHDGKKARVLLGIQFTTNEEGFTENFEEGGLFVGLLFEYGNYMPLSKFYEITNEFFNCVCYNGANTSTIWGNFQDYLDDIESEFGAKITLYNVDTFGQSITETSANIYPQATVLETSSIEDEGVNINVIREHDSYPYENRDSKISITYTGNKIGFNYKDSSDNDEICEYTKITFYIMSLVNEDVNNYNLSEVISNLVGSHIIRSTPTFSIRHLSNIDGSFWYRGKASLSIDETAKKLIKLTPYLTYNKNSEGEKEETIEFKSYSDINTDSYICQVFKPNNSNSVYNKFSIGKDIYRYGTTDTQGGRLNLSEFTSYAGPVATDAHYIYSNFNLNYVALTDDLTPQIRTFNNNTERQMFLTINSSTLSDIYSLPSMYKSYTRKYFAPFNRYNIYLFDNTVRASNVNQDEAHKSIYKFDAESMYNVPTNRGKITNMFSIGNSIYIHTEHSLYKFSGENKLSGTENEVKLEESDVFDTGISEIFDSENGFGGLHEKHNSVITYNSYFFYDKRSKIIYSYSGEGNLTSINQPIQKLLNFIDVYEVRFASDVRNDRIFIQLFSKYGNICLSYNVSAKQFVSIHDITINDAFSTRNNVYFSINNSIDKTLSLIGYCRFNYDTFGNYGDLFNKSILYTPIEENSTAENNYCILDVMFNDYSENVKIVDAISWICHHIKEYSELGLDNNNNKIISVITNAAEEQKFKYPGEFIEIYSDEGDTGFLELYDRSKFDELKDKDIYSSNAYKINELESYKYPRFNEGIWSFNYFRNKKTDVENTGIADNLSLVYGKYYVVRLVFNAKYNFKLENVIIKYKTK